MRKKSATTERSARLKEAIDELGLEVPEATRVLIVDDEWENVEVIHFLLHGYCDVSTARSADETLALLETDGDMDVVVADHRMPGMMGIDLLAELAKRGSRAIRILLTAQSDCRNFVAAIGRGEIHALVKKPYDPAGMRAQVVETLVLQTARQAVWRLVERFGGPDSSLRSARTRLEQALGEANGHRREALVEVGEILGRRDLAGVGAVLERLGELARADVRDYDLTRMTEHLSCALGAVQTQLGLAIELLGVPDAALAAPDAGGGWPPAELVARIASAFREEPVGRDRPLETSVADGSAVLRMDPRVLEQIGVLMLRRAARGRRREELLSLTLAPGADGEYRLTVRAASPVALADAADAGRTGDPPPDPLMDPRFAAFDELSLGLCLRLAEVTAGAQGGRLELGGGNGDGVVARLLIPSTGTGQHRATAM